MYLATRTSDYTRYNVPALQPHTWPRNPATCPTWSRIHPRFPWPERWLRDGSHLECESNWVLQQPGRRRRESSCRRNRL